MRQYIILTDEEINALKNDKIVPVLLRSDGPATVYLATRKGYEIDLKNDIDTFEQAAKNIEEARQAGHGCDTCKHNRKIITDEPCSSCDIRLGNNKWEAKDVNTES